jgi:hypothetical protein
MFDWLLDLYERWPRATVKVTAHIISIAIVTVAAMLVLNIYAYATADAAPSTPDTECVLWADIKPWAITRCESWETGETCMIATSGFLQCWRQE